MPSLKLTKSAVDTARPGTTDYELRDTIVPGFFCKIILFNLVGQQYPPIYPNRIGIDATGQSS